MKRDDLRIVGVRLTREVVLAIHAAMLPHWNRTLERRLSKPDMVEEERKYLESELHNIPVRVWRMAGYTRDRFFHSDLDFETVDFDRYEDIDMVLEGLSLSYRADITEKSHARALEVSVFSHHDEDDAELVLRDVRTALESFIDPALVEEVTPKAPPFKIFLGHGGDPRWRTVKKLMTKHDFTVEAFESAPRGSQNTLAVVDQAIRESAVGVIVMTGEDTMPDGTLRARQNVLHELGYCQGALGILNTVVLVQSGIDVPSNLAGLTQIRFDTDIADVEPDLLRELEQRRSMHDYRHGA